MTFYYENCFYLLQEKNCSNDQEKALTIEAEVHESLKQFIQRVKGQNNFRNRIISNPLEQL